MTSFLHDLRLRGTLEAIGEQAACSILDLGCGDGDLLLRLAADPLVQRIVAVDKSGDVLARLKSRHARSPGAASCQLEVRQESIVRLGADLAGFDCAVLVEVIEHMDQHELRAAEQVVFATLRPVRVIVTTPNAEFNELLGVPAHRFRHPDHRFEWTRAQLQDWAQAVARRHAYAVSTRDLAGSHPRFGGPSQMAIFTRA